MKFRSNNLLVTGGCGFIGSNFINYILRNNDEINIINLDKLTYAGSIDKTLNFKEDKRYKLIVGDINDYKLLKEIFNKYSINGVINFAAETHVDRSIASPEKFITTNINGVYNLLKISYESWFLSPHKPKVEHLDSRFHQISTDEVYGSIEIGSFHEYSQYKPNSPYSASKASADMLVRSFNKTYGLNVSTSVSSNNYGPNQNPEKLIPNIQKKISSNMFIDIYGNGKNVRDWIHVDDHCLAIELIFNKSLSGSKYNVASGVEISNIELAKFLFKTANKPEKINYTEDRFGHDFRYSLSTEKIKNDFNWKSKINFFEYFKKYYEK